MPTSTESEIFNVIPVKGYIIKTKYLGHTKTKLPRVKATYKKDADTIYSKTIKYNNKLADLDNYANAVRELLKTEWFKDFSPSVDIVSFGWDNDNYFFIVSSKEF